jgi:hypothetical protein
MKIRSLIVAATLFGAGLSGQAQAICIGATPADGCPQPFANTASGQNTDASTTTQGFDSRTQSQWTQTTTPFGTLKFSAGAGANDPWTNPQSRFSNGFGNPRPGVGTAGQSNGCAFYGNCQ